MIARLINGRFVPCPKQGRDGRGGLHTNLPRYYERHPDRAASDGWYDVQYTEKPAGESTFTWELRDGVLVQIWTPCANEPQLPTLEDRIDMIEDCLLELSELLYA